MADLSDVKKIIISLISTSPNGRPADLFNKDYKKQTGKSIPFAEYSYSSLTKFLEAEMKNNIRFEIRRGDVWLFPITNQKSGHITKMIHEQFVAKNKSSTSRLSFAYQPIRFYLNGKI